MLVAGLEPLATGGEDPMLGLEGIRTVAVRTIAATAVSAIATIAFVSMTPERARAYPSYESSMFGLPALPSGYAYECTDCHVNPSGGGAPCAAASGGIHPYAPCFNEFGIQYRTNGWSTTLQNGDADNDGILNGTELNQAGSAGFPAQAEANGCNMLTGAEYPGSYLACSNNIQFVTYSSYYNSGALTPDSTYYYTPYFSCATGYTGFTGTGTASWYCNLVNCGALAAPTNGTVSTPNGTTYNQSASYACNSGYVMSGSSSRTCQSNGLWSGSAPTCGQISCAALSNPTNGTVSDPSLTWGSVATYTCNSGYYVSSGSSSRTCSGTTNPGTWTGSTAVCSAITCTALTNPTNGTVTSNTAWGSTATYTCNAGYYVSSGSSSRTCGGTSQPGAWSGSAATCSQITCSALSNPTNGTVSYANTNWGTTATYACSSGYALSGSSTTTCSGSSSPGSWSNPAPTCNPVDCGALAAPTNGSVSTPGGTTYTQSATYACNAGYTMSGSPSRTCQANATWSGSAPTCVPVDCGALANPTNGSVSTPNGTTYGQTATYACNSGYALSGSGSRSCQSSATWSGSAPTCVPVDCGALAAPTNGAVSTPSGTTYTDVATYTCNAGYTMSGSSSRTCQANATWSGSAPTCPDTNECVVTPTICGPGTCVNTTGSYSCTCNSGYSFDGTTCVVSNACVVSNPCDTHATCTPTGGSTYTCACNAGWTGTGVGAGSCTDINECASSSLNNCKATNATCTNTPGSYTCGCASGYTGDGITSCTNINECANTPRPCATNAACTDTQGSYTCTTCGANASPTGTAGAETCACNAGYTGDPIAGCTDINECANSPSPCSGTQACVNTAGSYQCNQCGANALPTGPVGSQVCACKTGYTGDPIAGCVDINECASSSTNNCSTNATCTNTPGSFTCACKTGYSGDGVTCNDVNECANAALNNCKATNATCTNTTGSYVCGCQTGYVGDGVTSCTNVNECALTPRPCGATEACVDSPGSFACVACGANTQVTGTAGTESCTCSAGYTGDPIAGCTDVNECALLPRPCGASQACVNLAGSYQCNPCGANALPTGPAGSEVCACTTGYTGDPVAGCIDINECASSSTNNCDANATCTNTPGSFTCACKNGYSGDGVTCNDVNECADTALNNCKATNSTCTNTPGSFVCGCQAGYMGDGITLCTNINECTDVPRPCGATEACVDSPGSFACVACGANTEVTGVAGTESCTCNAGYTGDPIAGCTDINECALLPRPCSADQACVNLAGTYQCNTCGANATPGGAAGSEACACNAGYTGNASTGCTDIDECAAMTDNCGANGTCTNTPGSFTCACKGGFAGDGYTCTDIDECAAHTDNCDMLAMCKNTIGSFTCTCNAGYAGDGVTCTNIDECTDHIDNCSPNATCTDTQGSFTCTCNAGYEGSGTTCLDIDDCLVNNGGCLVNEVCVNQIGIPHTCECIPGFSRPTNDPTGACVSSCGNGQRATSEQCDDGNSTSGDGCSATCTIEPGWACHEPTPGAQSACTKTCGDGVIDPPAEQCDDGASNSDTTPNACRTTCKLASCGDSVVDTGETCDQGSMNSDTRPDACRTKCVTAFCGDGIVDPGRGEQCDHGFGDPLPDDYCATASGCRKAVPTGDGGLDGGTSTSHSKGCGCRVAGHADANAPTLAGLLLVALACVARARRRSARER